VSDNRGILCMTCAQLCSNLLYTVLRTGIWISCDRRFYFGCQSFKSIFGSI